MKTNQASGGLHEQEHSIHHQYGTALGGVDKSPLAQVEGMGRRRGWSWGGVVVGIGLAVAPGLSHAVVDPAERVLGYSYDQIIANYLRGHLRASPASSASLSQARLASARLAQTAITT